MDLMTHLSSLSLFYLTPLLIGFFIFVSIVTLWARTFLIKETKIQTPNPLVDRLVDMCAPVFAFLLASVVVMLISNRDRIEQAIQNETDSVTDVIFLSSSLPKDIQNQIYHDLKSYLFSIKNEEWGTLDKEGSTYTSRVHIARMIQGINTYFEQNSQNTYVAQNLIQSVQHLNDARRERHEASLKKIHPYMWFILFANASLSLFSLFFFLKRTTAGQCVSIILISTSFGLIFSVLIAFNSPFKGSLALSSNVIDDSVKMIESIHKNIRCTRDTKDTLIS